MEFLSPLTAASAASRPWDGTQKDALRTYLEHAVSVGLLAARHGLPIEAEGVVDGIIDQLDLIARESYPLANVFEGSHLVLRAQGPGATRSLPWLNAFNWLGRTAESSLRSWVSHWLTIKNADCKTLAKRLDLRLTGVAPGSIWMGFRLETPAPGLIAANENEQLFISMGERIGMLPTAAQCIGNESINQEIAQLLPDPAERDVMLSTLLRLAPTGKVGIHTVELAAPRAEPVRLSQPERVVLQAALKGPAEESLRYGQFTGDVRELDLDKTRLHLRTNDGVIRCVVPQLTVEHARDMIGSAVRLSGRYAADGDGRPRLLYVEKTERIGTAALPFT